jgi:hypothetical protein
MPTTIANQEDREEDPRDVRCAARHAGKPERAGDDRDHQEDQRPFQREHRLSPPPCSAIPLRRLINGRGSAEFCRTGWRSAIGMAA